MKFIVLVVGVLGLGVSACAEIAGDNPGNPDGMAYAGSPDSVYSASANPPKTIGTVTYDPNAVLPAPTDVPMTPNGSTNGTLPAQDYGPTVQRH